MTELGRSWKKSKKIKINKNEKRSLEIGERPSQQRAGKEKTNNRRRKNYYF